MSDTPKADANCGWPVGHHGRIECSDLKWSPDGPFVHSSVARELERENAALKAKVEVIVQNYEDYKAENAALNETARKHVAAYYELLDENTALRKELKEAQP